MRVPTRLLVSIRRVNRAMPGLVGETKTATTPIRRTIRGDADGSGYRKLCLQLCGVGTQGFVHL